MPWVVLRFALILVALSASPAPHALAQDKPEEINSSPHEQWMIVMKVTDPSELDHRGHADPDAVTFRSAGLAL